jgi:hypothetical protein
MRWPVECKSLMHKEQGHKDPVTRFLELAR